MGLSEAWPDTLVEELRQLASDGLSASKIGARLGVTRNTIIGKARRMGFRLGGSTGRQKTEWTSDQVDSLKALARNGMGVRRIAKTLGLSKSSVQWRAGQLKLKLKTVRKPRKTAIEPRNEFWQAFASLPRVKKVPRRVEPVEPKRLSLMDMEQQQCRWPYGKGPYTFCGHEKQRGFSYCEYHVAVAHDFKPEPRPTKLNSLKTKYGSKQFILNRDATIQEVAA